MAAAPHRSIHNPLRGRLENSAIQFCRSITLTSTGAQHVPIIPGHTRKGGEINYLKGIYLLSFAAAAQNYNGQSTCLLAIFNDQSPISLFQGSPGSLSCSRDPACEGQLLQFPSSLLTIIHQVQTLSGLSGWSTHGLEIPFSYLEVRDGKIGFVRTCQIKIKGNDS
ncbi:hypothetical protein CDAR_35531 [Caerostris darwini]|uniref:Uncharacterized protein n=1 Tax=Caerostris darwini TaxID=1538125 RepID=A0AAV4SIZ8_9ARAC|nr:hypothetical protein CDAR_35531 [Caerostris darwini]